MKYIQLKRIGINLMSGITQWIWNLNLSKYKNNYSHNINELFNNKTVAIIGAADSALNTGKGEYIDSFDVVVRINRGVFLAEDADMKKDIGKRTDVLVTYENLGKYGAAEGDRIFHLLHQQKVKAIIVPMLWQQFTARKEYFFLKNYLSKLGGGIKVYYLSHERKSFKKLLNGKTATTGFAAILSVLQSDFKQCYITGFTFFKTEYAKGYRANATSKEAVLKYIDATGLHDVEQEFTLFKKIVKKDKRVTLDDYLNKIMQD